MDNEQLLEYLLEMMRITRSLRAAIRQITELKVEVAALYQIIETNGIATAEQLHAIREEARATLKEVETSTTIHTLVPAMETEGEWKM